MPYHPILRNEFLFESHGGVVAPSKRVAVGDAASISLHFIGIEEGDILQIEGSNEENPTAWTQLGENVTEDELLTLEDRPRWIRVNRTDITGGGDVTVILQSLHLT